MPIPESIEMYPGTSGNTHGDKNEISPARNAPAKETSVIPDSSSIQANTLGTFPAIHAVSSNSNCDRSELPCRPALFQGAASLQGSLVTLQSTVKEASGRRTPFRPSYSPISRG